VYLGEWAAHDRGRRSTLRAALSEAAYYTSLERNGDIVAMASYAPLLARISNTHWSPNLVFFNKTEVLPTISYEVQKLLSCNGGDIYLKTKVEGAEGRFAVSTVKDSQSGDITIKLVNGENDARMLWVKLKGLSDILKSATKTVLSGSDPDAVNAGRGDAESDIVPVSEKQRVGSSFEIMIDPNSLTIFRIPTILQ
jgi:alpha-L-arabinofuranosidase